MWLCVISQGLDRLENARHLDKNGSIKVLMETLLALSSLRSFLIKGLESGLRNDASDTAIAMRQKVYLPDTTEEVWVEIVIWCMYSNNIHCLSFAVAPLWDWTRGLFICSIKQVITEFKSCFLVQPSFFLTEIWLCLEVDVILFLLGRLNGCSIDSKRRVTIM
jgi:hypothetical protein